MMRAALRPWRFIQPAFRYQFRDDNYRTRTESDPFAVDTGSTSHIYTYDVTLQPTQDLLVTASFSRQDVATRTPAEHSSVAQTPTFNAGVGTWLLSVSQTVNEALAFEASLQHSRADNFDDFSANGKTS